MRLVAGGQVDRAPFEVGTEVRSAFLEGDPKAREVFEPNARGRFMADLSLLARRRLQGLGVSRIYGGGECTFTQADRYYSHSWGGDLATTWERMKAHRRRGALTWTDGESVALVADGDRVVHHSFSRSTHTGTVFGVEASDRDVTFHSLEIWRVENGKIVEHWGGFREAERFYDQLIGEEP